MKQKTTDTTPLPGVNYTGNQIVERWDYSAFQKPTKVSGAGETNPQVNAGLLVIGRYQNHAGSGLQLALYRGYDPELGRWISEDPIAERGGLNLYGYVLNRPNYAIDLFGEDLWIEGASGNEPAGHQSVCVGNPNGTYKSYSFGINGGFSAGHMTGDVYVDRSYGGEIDSSNYSNTDSEADQDIQNLLDGIVGNKHPYALINQNCRTFSHQIYDKLKGMGTPGKAPSRKPPTHSGIRGPTFMTTDISPTS